jgi:(p)ppGpp synthase/HD superfamily hydrolase
MNNAEKLDIALIWAVKAHKGQKDKSGKPYILHPLAVMNNVESMNEKIVAILHDVVEDTDTSLTAIQNLFGSVIAEGVDAMTHRPNEPNIDYWKRVKENNIAKQVKQADILHNTSAKRMECLDPETRERLTTKYKKALTVIMGD